MCVCLSVWVPVMFYFRCFSFFANTCQRLNYFVCARPIGGQHDGHLPFWLPSFVKFIMLKLYVCVCIAEINILLHWTLNPFNKCADLNLPDFMQWLQNSFRSHSHSFFVNTSCQRLLLRLCYRWPAWWALAGSSPEAHLARTREWPNPNPNSNLNPKNHSREVRFWTRPALALLVAWLC